MSLRSKLAERARRLEVAELTNNFAQFFRACWPIIEPQTELVDSWHYALLAEYLELITSGEFKRRFPEKAGIIINVPPRSAKSSQITVAWPVWSWLQRPSLRFLFASYSGNLSANHSILRRNLMQSPWYQERFGGRFNLSADINRIDDVGNDKTGRMISTSTGGTCTGLGGEIAIADDLLSQDEGFSDAAIAAAIRWVHGTWSTKLDNPSTGVFVYVSQRIAQNDVPGTLLEEQPGRFIHVKVPLEAPESVRYVFPKSGRVFDRPAGDVLQPQRFPPYIVEGLKENSRAWANQYEQEPTPASGGIIKRHWWRFYVHARDQRPEGCLVLPDRFDEVIQAWDMSFRDRKNSDLVCGGVWGRRGAMKYLLDIFWERADFVATKKAVINLSARWPEAHAKYVEARANGDAILSELKGEISGLIGVEPAGGKEARLYACSPDIEAGNVVLPHPSIAPWTPRFVDECSAACCGGKHDDAADMTALAIPKLRRMNFTTGWLWGSVSTFTQLRKQNPESEGLELAMKHGLIPGGTSTQGGNNVDPADPAKAQIESFNRTTTGRGFFGAEKSPAMQTNHVKVYRVPSPDRCPNCRNAAIAKYDGWSRCACGWDSRVVPTPTPEPEEAQRKPDRSIGDFLLSALGVK